MNEELEKEIEKKKQQLRDYLRVSELIRTDPEERNRQIDFFLDDLIQLLKKRE